MTNFSSRPPAPRSPWCWPQWRGCGYEGLDPHTHARRARPAAAVEQPGRCGVQPAARPAAGRRAAGAGRRLGHRARPGAPGPASAPGAAVVSRCCWPSRACSPTAPAGAISAGLFSVALAAYLWFGAGQSLRAAELMDRVPRSNLRRCCVPGCWSPRTCRSPRRCAGPGPAMPAAWSSSTPATVPARSSTSRASARCPAERRPWTSLDTVSRPAGARPGAASGSPARTCSRPCAPPPPTSTSSSTTTAPRPGSWPPTDLAAALQAPA